MITYELALKLKNAGFPQEGSGVALFPNGDTFRGPFIGVPNFVVYQPSLSELIEACRENGGTFSSLSLIEGKWKAQGFHNEKDIFVYNQFSTPEEAVANLYLALNENKKEGN